MTITLGSRSDFTLENCKRVAWGGERVVLSAAAKERMAKARAYLMKLVERPDISIYGVNTGYGHEANPASHPRLRMHFSIDTSAMIAGLCGGGLSLNFPSRNK